MVLFTGACIDIEPEGELGDPNLATVQQAIFTAKCALAECHAGGSPRQGMSLEPGKASGLTINVTALEAPMFRIKPGDPDNSYLIAKIEGRNKDVGGSGERMPLGFAPLSTAEIKLVRDWITSLGTALQAPPKITGITPAAGAIGDRISIEGENFGDKQGDSAVTFGTTPASFVGNWSNKKFEAFVPQGLNPGPVDLIVKVGTKTSNKFPFTIRLEKVPSIVALTPDMGPVGAEIELRGSNFGAAQATSTITFGGTAAAPATAWADGTIKVLVPAGAKTGDIVVTVGGGASNGQKFWFLEPKLSSLQEGLFTRRCALSTCHGSPTPPPQDCGGKPGQSLIAGNTFANIVGVTSCEQSASQRVQPGNHAASYLYMKVSQKPPPVGDQMPADGTPPLPAPVIQVLADWIDQGAKND